MTLYNKKHSVISDSSGIGVNAKPGESFDSLIRRFKRLISKEGIIKEVNDRRYYKKKSIVKKRRKSESIKRSSIKKETKE